jgi:hypothetical protein
MIVFNLLLGLSMLGQLPAAGSRSLERSAYFAFADHEYIFTVEVVKPGVPILNFVSMADQDVRLLAKNIRLFLDNRTAAVRLLAIETGEIRQPMVVSDLTIHPRSSFGVRLDGDFDNTKELSGATIRLGGEDFKLAPLTSFDFESLVLKVNRINLESPDFSDDWRVLRLELLGSRSAAHR